MSAATRRSQAKLAEEVREYHSGLRDYARRERAVQRRLDSIPPEGGVFTASPAEQCRLVRSGQRDARRVRRLTERALRAMDGKRWDDALSDLIDAAAILHEGGGCLTPSRGGYEMMAAKELDDILEQLERRPRRAA